ncbi:MAG: hypothetical protein HYS40_05655 [Gemmatimonadetes bacterium]|nr:hypothetical protein [Gemmatimonadota bacterium]
MRRTAFASAVLAALACDGGLEPVPEPSTCPASFQGICGTVVFRGALPESTDVAYVVAYARFPQSQADLFTYTPTIPPTLDLPDSTADSVRFYTLPLIAGRYEWVLAVWKKQGTLTFANADSLLREAGYYRNPADPSQPGIVNVYGASTDSIDFVVDFTNMHPVSYYFPLARQ